MLKSVFKTIKNRLNQKRSQDNDRFESRDISRPESNGRTAGQKKSGVFPHWWLYRTPPVGMEDDKQETSNSDSLHFYVE